MKTYRVYLRTPDQRVCHKTTTESARAAMAAFAELVARSDLDGSDQLIVLNADGRPVAHHRCDGKDPQKWWRGRTDEIDLAHPA